MRLNVKNIVEALTYLKSEINTLLAGKADVGHDHDGRYYTESEMNTLLNDKAGKNIATTSSDGLMSSSDKTKLDGVEAGANKTTVDSSLSATSTNPVQNKIVKSALDGKSNTGHNHDERYYTESEINAEVSRLEGLIDGVAGFSAVEVSTLPSEGANGVLYLVPKTGGVDDDVHDEYVWVEDSGSFELVGSTTVNMSNYYTQTQTDTLLAGKSSIGHTHDDRYYTESEMNTLLAGKASTSTATTSSDGLMSSADKAQLDDLSEALSGKLEIVETGRIQATKNDITGSVSFIKAKAGSINILIVSNINLRFTDTTGKDTRTLYPISNAKIPLTGFNVNMNFRILNCLTGAHALFLVGNDGTVSLRMVGSVHTNMAYGECTYISLPAMIPEPVEGEPATISLIVDNDTIMVGETATLTATVLDGDGLPCEGVEVSFSSDITNTTPYSNITNNQGMATYSYDSEGVGDFTVTASVEGLSDSVLIQDCFFQDPMTSESGKWSVPSGVSLSYSDEGATLTATSYENLVSVGSWTAQPVTLEFTVKQVTNNKEAQPLAMIANGSGLPLMGISVKNSVWTIMRNNTSTSSTTNYLLVNSISLKQGDIIRLKQTSTNYIVEVERSGEVIKISDTEWTYDASTFNIRFDTGTNRSLTFRDVKLKPLME